MKTAQSIIRTIILLSLGTVALFGIFCVPDDQSKTWLSDVAVSKAIGAASLLLFMRLHRRWHAPDSRDISKEKKLFISLKV